jgi:hypothetical protein
MVMAQRSQDEEEKSLSSDFAGHAHDSSVSHVWLALSDFGCYNLQNAQLVTQRRQESYASVIKGRACPKSRHPYQQIVRRLGHRPPQIMGSTW